MLQNHLISDFIYSIQVSNFEDMFDQWPWPGFAKSKQGMDPYQPISSHDQYVLLPPSVPIGMAIYFSLKYSSALVTLDQYIQLGNPCGEANMGSDIIIEDIPGL